ncbi:NFX1-type zinc finger-containing protein 1 [Mactra antiquata]
MAEGRDRRGGRPELHRRGFRAGRPLDDDDNDDFDDEAGGQRARHMREIRGNRDDRDERDNRRPRNDQDGGRRNDRDNRRDDRGAGRRDVGRGRNRGQGGNEGGRPGRKLILSECFMRDDLVKRDPANIVLTLSSPQTAFREALIECVKKTNMLKIMLSVLAKAFKCKSTPEQFNRAYIIIEESRFFDNVASYFLDMQAEDSYIRQLEFKQPIHDMICVMEGLVDKNPTSITQFVGIHDILKTVIDNLRERSTVIDDDLLKSFSAFTERKELLLKRGMG